MNELSDPEKQKKLGKLGIRVRDSAGNFRDFNDIMFDIVEKAEKMGNADFFGTIFGRVSMQAVRSYMTQGGRMYESLINLGDTTGLLQKKSATMAGTLQSNIKNLQTAFNSFADSNLTKPLEHLTDLLNKLAEDPERIKKVFTGIAVGIGAIATVKGIAGISRLVGSLMQLKGGKIDLANSLNMATAMPVYVTNWGGDATGIGAVGQFQQPQQSLTPQLSNNPSTSAKATVGNITPKQYAGAAGGAAITAAFVKIPQMINELDAIKQNEELTAKERGKAKGGAIGDASGSIIGAAAGGAAGIAAGAAVGAAVGSVVPILGTAIGALVGAGIGAAGMWLGGKAGRAIGGSIGESMADNDSPAYQAQRPRLNGKSAIRFNKVAVTDLPPQITQTGSSVTPQKVELGKADINLNVTLTDDRPSVTVAAKNNTMPVRFNPGSRVAQRRNGM
jgi:phage tail tape-measure protein